MEYCKLRDVNGLTSLTSLQILNLRGNDRGINVNVLTTLTNLKVLNLAETNIDGNNLSSEHLATLFPLMEKNVTIYFGRNEAGRAIATGPLRKMFDVTQ